MEINLEKMNSNIELLNSVFEFRETYEMQDDCILDVLKEYAHKHDVDVELLARELADLEGFVELVQIDLVKHKYVRESSESDVDEWS